MAKKIERIIIDGMQIPSNGTLHIVASELEALERESRIKKNNNQFVDIQISSNETRRILVSESTTLESIKNFINNSNEMVRYLRYFFNYDAVECCRFSNMGLRLMNNYKAQCKLTGVDVSALWYSEAVIAWFPVLSYLEVPNRSDLIKLVVKKGSVLKKRAIDSNAIEYFDDVHNLNRFTQFKQANSFHNQHELLAYELSKNNQQMKDLLIQRVYIYKEMISIDVEPHRICRFCLSFFNVKISPDKWKSCGSSKCKAAYIRANRQKNHPKRKWIHDPTALKPCIGKCVSNRKKLNSERVCFGCYKPFS
jgi:hypothetical protein